MRNPQRARPALAVLGLLLGPAGSAAQSPAAVPPEPPQAAITSEHPREGGSAAGPATAPEPRRADPGHGSGATQGGAAEEPASEPPGCRLRPGRLELIV